MTSYLISILAFFLFVQSGVLRFQLFDESGDGIIIEPYSEIEIEPIVKYKAIDSTKTFEFNDTFFKATVGEESFGWELGFPCVNAAECKCKETCGVNVRTGCMCPTMIDPVACVNAAECKCQEACRAAGKISCICPTKIELSVNPAKYPSKGVAVEKTGSGQFSFVENGIDNETLYKFKLQLEHEKMNVVVQVVDDEKQQKDDVDIEIVNKKNNLFDKSPLLFIIIGITGLVAVVTIIVVVAVIVVIRKRKSDYASIPNNSESVAENMNINSSA